MGEHSTESIIDWAKLLGIPDGYTIFIITGYSDLRKGINGLCDYVDALFNLNPYEENVFLFCGRKADRFKALVKNQEGCILASMVFDEGRLKWPRGKNPQAWKISRKQLNQLLTGSALKLEDVLEYYEA